MKKIIVVMFFIIFSFSIGRNIKNISEIKTLDIMVKEKSFFNKESQEKKYNLKYIVPNIIKKEFIEPESHRGEIFIYKNGIKKIYLPIFEEVIEDKESTDENSFVEIISFLQKKDKESKKFRNLYNSGKEIFIKNKNLKIKLKELKLIKNFYIPTVIEIFDKDALIGKLAIYNISINKSIDKKEFDI